MVQACKSDDPARDSGRRVRNTWVIYLRIGNNISKEVLILDNITFSYESVVKVSLQRLTFEEEPAAYQLVGEVTAHQGY